MDTLGHLLAVHVTPANKQDRAQVEQLAKAVQEATGHNVQVAYVDAGYTGEKAAEAAEGQGSGWRWSSCRVPNEASFCCPDVG